MTLKLLPRRLVEQLPSGEGAVAAAVASGDETALVVAPAHDPLRAVSALDDVGWIAPDVAPAILARVTGTSDGLLPVQVAPEPATLYVQGWLERLLAAAETLRWAGAELGLVLLLGTFQSLSSQLSRPTARWRPRRPRCAGGGSGWTRLPLRPSRYTARSVSPPVRRFETAAICGRHVHRAEG